MSGGVNYVQGVSKKWDFPSNGQNQHHKMKQLNKYSFTILSMIALMFASCKQEQQQAPQQPPQPGSQLEMVLAEARRLEEVAHRNEDELRLLAIERGDEDDPNIRAEIMQLKQRLAGTDQELQKTNQTLR